LAGITPIEASKERAEGAKAWLGELALEEEALSSPSADEEADEGGGGGGMADVAGIGMASEGVEPSGDELVESQEGPLGGAAKRRRLGLLLEVRASTLMLKLEGSNGNLPVSRAATPASFGLKVTEGGWSRLRKSMNSWKRDRRSSESESDTSGDDIVGSKSGGWCGCHVLEEMPLLYREQSLDQGRLKLQKWAALP
jgi:hypothetical protein